MISTIYKTLNGEIIRIIDAPEDMIAMQLKDGESYINGQYDDDLYYIEFGKPKLKPTKPEGDYVWNPDTKKWVYAKTEQDLANEAMFKRNDMLFACDWTQVPDSPLSESKKAEWRDYRQHLRDITKQSGFPTKIDWGTPPSEE